MNPGLNRRSRALLWLLLACGPAGAWMALQWGLQLGPKACAPLGWLSLLLAAPVLEEIVFRRGLHAWLSVRLHQRVGPLSLANALTALLFASVHALHQGSALLLLTAVPALLIGLAWETSGQRLRVAVALHGWYNACLLISSCHWA